MVLWRLYEGIYAYYYKWTSNMYLINGDFHDLISSVQCNCGTSIALRLQGQKQCTNHPVTLYPYDSASLRSLASNTI